MLRQEVISVAVYIPNDARAIQQIRARLSPFVYSGDINLKVINEYSKIADLHPDVLVVQGETMRPDLEPSDPNAAKVRDILWQVAQTTPVVLLMYQGEQFDFTQAPEYNVILPVNMGTRGTASLNKETKHLSPIYEAIERVHGMNKTR